MDNKVKQKEEIFGRFSSILAERVPLEYKPLIFASAVCARDPSAEEIWHPYFINSSWINKLVKITSIFFCAFIIGIIKVVFKLEPGYITQLNGRHDILLVATNQIVFRGPNNSFRTPYLDIPDKSKVDWLILDYGSKSESFNFKKFPFSRIQILKINWLLFRNSLSVLIYCYKSLPNKFLFTEAFLLFLIWILRQNWMSIFALGEILNGLVKKYKYKFVFSPHEMLAYSHALWFWSEKLKVRSATLQHAVIYRNKLLFFPTELERLAGLRTPDIFYIFSPKYISLLRSYMPETEFIVGSSPRFDHDVNYIIENIRREEKNKQLLIVTSMCWFDIKSMLSVTEKLLKNSNGEKKINIRLHPYGNFTIEDLLKIQFLKWIKQVNFSKQTLREDLENAWMVIGCGSSVVFEAMLYGIPTVLAYDSRFTSFDTEGIYTANIVSAKVKSINWEFLNDVATDSNLIELQKETQDLLGINNSRVDSEIITNLQNERMAVLR